MKRKRRTRILWILLLIVPLTIVFLTRPVLRNASLVPTAGPETAPAVRETEPAVSAALPAETPHTAVPVPSASPARTAQAPDFVPPTLTPEPAPGTPAAYVTMLAEARMEAHETRVPDATPRTAPERTAEPVPTEPPAPEGHVHVFVPVTEEIFHEAKTETVKIVDMEAWDQPVYEEIPTFTCGCGQVFYSPEAQEAHSRSFDDAPPEEIARHNHCSNTVERRLTGYVHWDEEYHYEERTVEPAWIETVTTYRCGCGAVRSG